VKAVKLKHGDRVRRIRDGATADVIDVHPSAPRISVLPDEGPRALQVWERDQVEVTGKKR
jgi:hypothetical protein